LGHTISSTDFLDMMTRVSGRWDLTNLAAVAALNEPVRRALFDLVRSAPLPLTREEAADGVGISRKLAAFHLDKLVAVGLLAVDTTARATARVGRRPRAYRLAPDTDIQVAIPARRPQLLARLLLQAATHQLPGEDGVTAALRVSRDEGHAVGADERAARRPGRLGTERALTLLCSLLERLGCEPSRQGSGPVRFRSCPFHPLAAETPQVVCGIHHAYLSGLVAGLDASSVQVLLRPGTDGCCIELRGSDGRA